VARDSIELVPTDRSGNHFVWLATTHAFGSGWGLVGMRVRTSWELAWECWKIERRIGRRYETQSSDYSLSQF